MLTGFLSWSDPEHIGQRRCVAMPNLYQFLTLSVFTISRKALVKRIAAAQAHDESRGHDALNDADDVRVSSGQSLMVDAVARENCQATSISKPYRRSSNHCRPGLWRLVHESPEQSI